MKHMRSLWMFFSVLVTQCVLAVSVSPKQAETAVRNWLGDVNAPLGAKFQSPLIKGVRGVTAPDGSMLYYVAEIDGSGFVITSSDTELTPIVAFSTESGIDDFEGSPLQALLGDDLRGRLEGVAKGIDASRMTSSVGGQAKGPAASAAAVQWASLLRTNESVKGRRSSVSDIRVAKLLETEWNQSTWDNRSNGIKVFNYYTPNNYVCGCVATAGAQIMKYWEYPTTAISEFSNPNCSVSGTTVTKTSLPGAFDWSHMPLSVSEVSSPNATQCAAIGKLTYNIGVAVGMGWSSGGSNANTSQLTASLKSRFGYVSGNFIWYYTGTGSALSGDAENALYASLDAGMPVSLSIGGDEGGHSVVADGYGYESNVRYTHINMGWSGQNDVWYNLMGDEIYTSVCTFTTLKGIGFNIHPRSAGDVISGRVITSAGSAAPGATVVLMSSAETEIARTTSNARGIYCFRISSPGTYRVRATSGTQQSADATVIVNSLSSSSGSGNRWGNDLLLGVVSNERSNLAFVTGTWPQAVILNTSSSTIGPMTSFTSTDTIHLHVSFGNTGTSVIPNAYKIRHEVLRGSTVVASWVYDTVDADRMEPGGSRCWSDYTWSGLNGLAAGSYTYRVTLDPAENITESNESDNVYNYSFTVQSGSIVSLPVALDNSELSFTTGGAANWFGQSVESYYGGYAARSGAVSDNENTWLKTTVNGMGTISFRWKVSSEATYDKLSFYVDDVLQNEISGTTDWSLFTVNLTSAGTHVLKWVYAKDVSRAVGDDCGWVDQVSWTTASTTATVTFDPQGGTLPYTTRTYSVGGQHTPFPTPRRDGYLFTGWYTAVFGGTEVNVATPVVSNNRTLYAHWVASSISLDAALSTNMLTFTTGGDASWFQHRRYCYDGIAAGQSGYITANQSSWIQTVIEGAGQLSFRFASSSESGYDILSFSVDGVVKASMSGSGSWSNVVENLSSGTHTLRWVYAKDGSRDVAWDCGYLDDVRWMPIAPTTVKVAFNGNGGVVSESERVYLIGRNYSYLPSATRSGYRFAGWYTLANGGRLITENQVVEAEVTSLYAHWTAISTLSLSTVLDAPDLTFTTGGDAAWFGQSADSYDGGGSAQSGLIGNDQSSWMQTVVNGPGTLTFWWKTSSESGWDYLSLVIDEEVVQSISGIRGWEQYSYEITGSGSHTVRWVYAKDSSNGVGEDCGRVDAITFGTPQEPTTGNGYALLVGVNKYDPAYVNAQNWLTCCEVDVNNVKSLLMLPKCGWSSGDITALLDAQATKNAIKTSLNTLAAHVQSGDRVVYYHSSHGGQYSGTSTCICTYNSDFSDVDFAEAISVLPSGVKLLIVIDACHSGGMFKAYGLSTGQAAFDAGRFVANVENRLNEIRYQDLVSGRKGAPKISASEIAWVTAADYDEYSWGGSSGSSFTTTFCDSIRNGTADQPTSTYGAGNGDGVITAYEAAKYTQDYWREQTIQGSTMTPQLGNESALRAFAFTDSATPPLPSEKPNLRWEPLASWSTNILFLSSEDSGATVPETSFDYGDPVYMYGGFQNNGTTATPGSFRILHQLYLLGDTAPIAEWEYEYPGSLQADPDSVTYWEGAEWDELQNLEPGSYRYQVTLDSDDACSELDETDNVASCTFIIENEASVSITFNANGGSPASVVRSYAIGGSYGDLPSVVRTGYSFEGWYTRREGGEKIIASTLVSASINTLYAHWTRTQYADLTATLVSPVQNSISPGQDFDLRFQIHNHGSVSASATRAAIFAEIDGNEVEVIGYVTIPAIGAGGMYEGTFAVAADNIGESVVLQVMADSDDTVDESDEENNCSETCTVSVSIVTPPSWYTASISIQPVMPTVFENVKLVMCDGRVGEIGDAVGAFRADTGELCGRAVVGTADGMVTFCVYVPTGITIDFRIFDADQGEFEVSRDSSVQVTASSIVSGMTLTALDPDAEWECDVSMAMEGWNLVSFCALPQDASPAAVFTPVSSMVRFVISSDNSMWGPSMSGSSLTEIELGRGYWVNTTANNVSFTVRGQGNAQTQISLVRGWNLVGYTLRSPCAASEALSSARGAGKIRYVSTPGETGLFPYDQLTLKPGVGYWVYSDENCSFQYDDVASQKSAEAIKEPAVGDPWSSMEITRDGMLMPTVIDEMSVKFGEQNAVKGDVVALLDTEGSLYARGVVDDAGKVTLALYAAQGKTLTIKCYRPANANVYETGTGTLFTVPAAGSICKDLTVVFNQDGPLLEYRVVYQSGRYGSGSVALSTKKPGEVLALSSSTFTRTGYTQTGWAMSDGGPKAYDLGGTYTADADATLYPYWTVNTYSISYVLNSGSHGMSHPTGVSYDQVFNVSAPTRNGYTFQGWTVTRGLDSETAKWGTTTFPATSIDSSSTKCNADPVYFMNLSPVKNGSVTLTANWTELPPQTYTIVYMPGCEDAEQTMDSQVANVGALVQLQPNAFVRAGYDFAGWSLEEQGDVDFNDGVTVDALGNAGETVYLYAVWRSNVPDPVETVAVTFHSNDSRNLKFVREYEKYTYYGNLPNIGTMGPYFAGWYTEPDGGIRVTERTFVSPNCRDLYAVWLYVEGGAYFAVTPKETNVTKNPNEITDEAIEWSIDSKHWFPVDGTPIEVKAGTFTMKFRSRDHRWLAPAARKVKAVRNKVVAVAPVATRVNLVWVDREYGEGASGKVSTSIARARQGKSVTLKATPGKNCVLAYWRNADTDAVLGTSTTLTLKPSRDLNIVAEFRKKSAYSALEKPQQFIDDWELEALEYGGYGEKFTIQVQVDDEQWPVSFSASGLPPGLKINTVTGVISGSPTKPGSYTIKVKVASKVNPKKYTIVSYKVRVGWYDDAVPLGSEYGPYYVGTKVDELVEKIFEDLPQNCTVSGLPPGLKFSKGKLTGVPTQIGSFNAVFSSKQGTKVRKTSTMFTVVALPAWAKGTFTGGAEAAKLAMSISSAGKISGSLLKDGSNWTFAASSYTFGFDDYLECTNIVAKCGSRRMPIAISVSPNEIVSTNSSTFVRGILLMEAGDEKNSTWIDAWQSPWGLSSYKTFANKYLKNRTLALSGDLYGLTAGEKISLKLSNTGSVVATGRFAVGVTKGKTVYYSATSSSMVSTSAVPDASFHALIFIYFPPQKAKSFAGYVRCVGVVLRDGELVLAE